jgi:hypothetical protein
MTKDFIQYIENKMESLPGTRETPSVMLEHLSWNQKEFFSVVEERLVDFCESAEWHAIPRAYKLVRRLLSFQDDLQREREVRIVRVLVDSIVQSKNICSAVTQFNMYELMVLACQNEGVLAELRSEEYIKEILPSFVQWLDVEKEQVDKFRNMSLRKQRNVEHPPWDEVTRNCIQSIIAKSEKIQMSGYNPSIDEPNSIVGRRISVFWGGNATAYEGTITKYSSSSGKHEGELFLFFSRNFSLSFSDHTGNFLLLSIH